jgi:hypothetical protein
MYIRHQQHDDMVIFIMVQGCKYKKSQAENNIKEKR